MLTILKGSKRARLSTDTFLKGAEEYEITKAKISAAKCGIHTIKKISVKLDNRSGGVSRFRVDIYGDYTEPFSYPWHICYSMGWEMRTYGIGKGHKNGIWGQFPGNDGEYDFISEQLYAACLGFTENPKPGFRVVTSLVRLEKKLTDDSL